jgi:K+-transporting ATPase A subunit
VILQIVLFYLLIAYLMGVLGTYMCWKAEEEDRHIQQVVREYRKVRAIEEEEGKRQLQEPLLL